MYKKLHFTIALLLFVSAFSFAQTTFTWNSYPGAATSWTNGNLSIAFTGSGNYSDGAPKFGNPQVVLWEMACMLPKIGATAPHLPQ